MPTTRNFPVSNRLITAVAVLAGTIGLGSCLKAPDYSVVPKISFESIKLKSVRVGGSAPNTSDTVRVTINFQDGDGDLGLGGRFGVLPDDARFPYAYKNRDSTINRFNNNFFAEAYRKNRVTGAFEKLSATDPSKGVYNERYPRLTSAETKVAPLKGTILRTYAFALGSPFFPGDEVRFQISIVDRALHESNVITTASVIIPRR